MSRARVPWWLPAVALACVGFALSLVQPTLALHRDIRFEAVRSLVDLERTYMGDPAPAIRAARRLANDPRASIYDQDLAVGSAFIYPPLAALLYRPLAFLPIAEAQDRLTLATHVLWAAVFLLLASRSCASAMGRNARGR